MSPRQQDHFVSFRSAASIALIAESWLAEGGVRDQPNFNIIDFVENTLLRRPIRGETLRIALFDAPEEAGENDLAFVSYKPLTLHADRGLWNEAKLGEPRARYIIAHEIGHVVLHDHGAKGFYSSQTLFARSGSFPDEQRAEWQANTFADHFLMRTQLVIRYSDAGLTARHFGVQSEDAERRIRDIGRAKNSGDFCPSCGSVAINMTGTSRACACGWSSSA